MVVRQMQNAVHSMHTLNMDNLNRHITYKWKMKAKNYIQIEYIGLYIIRMFMG